MLSHLVMTCGRTSFRLFGCRRLKRWLKAPSFPFIRLLTRMHSSRIFKKSMLSKQKPLSIHIHHPNEPNTLLPEDIPFTHSPLPLTPPASSNNQDPIASLHENDIHMQFFGSTHHRSNTLTLVGLQKAVKLPPGEDRREWIAVHASDFYTQVNMLWGVMSEFCAASSCPIMSAGEKYQYRWRTFDASSTSTHYRMHSTSTITSGEKSNMSDQHISHRQHTISLSAPDYIERVLDWCRQVLDDPRLFPTQPGATFDRDFMTVCRTLFKRLFRVYAHIYASHLDVIHMLDASEHLNTSFKHFVLFVREFELLDSKELRPAADLIQSLTKTPV